MNPVIAYKEYNKITIIPAPKTSFTPQNELPKIKSDAYIHPMASVIGDTTIESGVNIEPFASIRADEGAPIYIGKDSNIQDNVVIHGLRDDKYEKNGHKYSVYIGENTSLAHQSQVHGPSIVGDNVFVGMQAFVFKAKIGDNVVIEPAAKIIGVEIPPNRYIEAGKIIKKQEDADKLPVIDDNYIDKNINKTVVEDNKELAKGYLQIMAYPQNYYLLSYNVTKD